MRTSTKIWAAIAVALFLAGGTMFAAVMTTLGWDFTKLSTVTYDTVTHDVTDEYTAITVVTDTADIAFVPSDTDKTSVVCHETDTMRHAVAVKDGVLTIETVNDGQWSDYIGIHTGAPRITVYLPKGDHGALSVTATTSDVSVAPDFTFAQMDISLNTGDISGTANARQAMRLRTTTGDIRLESVSAATVELTVTTGDVHIMTGTCDRLISSGDTGDMALHSVVASGDFSIERNTGDVRMESCDAASITVRTDTGDVTGYFLTEKQVSADTNTGDMDIAPSLGGEPCNICTDTGDITVRFFR